MHRYFPTVQADGPGHAARCLVVFGRLPTEVQVRAVRDPRLAGSVIYNVHLDAGVWERLYFARTRLNVAEAAALLHRQLTEDQLRRVLAVEHRRDPLISLYRSGSYPLPVQEELFAHTDDYAVHGAWSRSGRVHPELAEHVARVGGVPTLIAYLSRAEHSPAEIVRLMNEYPWAWDRPRLTGEIERLIARHRSAVEIAAGSQHAVVRACVAGSRHLTSAWLQERIVGLSGGLRFDGLAAVTLLVNPVLDPGVHKLLQDRIRRSRKASWAKTAAAWDHARTGWVRPGKAYEDEDDPQAVRTILASLNRMSAGSDEHRFQALLALCGNGNVSGTNLDELVTAAGWVDHAERDLVHQRFAATFPARWDALRALIAEKDADDRNRNRRITAPASWVIGHSPAAAMTYPSTREQAAEWVSAELADDDPEVWAVVFSLADSFAGSLSELIAAARIV